MVHEWQELNFTIETGWTEIGVSTYIAELAFVIEPKYALQETQDYSLMWLMPTRNVFEFEHGLVHFTNHNNNLVVAQTIKNIADFNILERQLTASDAFFYKLVTQKE